METRAYNRLSALLERGKRLCAHASRHDAGNALIELAFVMPIFSLLLLGAADFARFAYASIEVANAARAGVQYGAQNHGTAVDLAGMRQAALNDSPDVAEMTATAQNTCKCSNGTGITCANAATACVSPARILQYVQVNTSAKLNTLFPYPALPSSLTLKGQASMRVQQ